MDPVDPLQDACSSLTHTFSEDADCSESGVAPKAVRRSCLVVGSEYGGIGGGAADGDLRFPPAAQQLYVNAIRPSERSKATDRRHLIPPDS